MVQSKADPLLSLILQGISFTLFWDAYYCPWEEEGLWFDAVWYFKQSQEGIKRAWILFA